MSLCKNLVNDKNTYEADVRIIQIHFISIPRINLHRCNLKGMWRLNDLSKTWSITMKGSSGFTSVRSSECLLSGNVLVSLISRSTLVIGGLSCRVVTRPSGPSCVCSSAAGALVAGLRFASGSGGLCLMGMIPKLDDNFRRNRFSICSGKPDEDDV